MARTWNCRVIKYDDLLPGGVNGEYYHAIHEVHYNDGVIVAYTAESMDVGGNGLEETKAYYDLLGEAFDAPVLLRSEMPKGDEDA